MKHTTSLYWVERKRQGIVTVIPHTYEGKERHYKFLDRKKAIALMKSEQDFDNLSLYRIVKETTIIDEGKWI